MSDEPPVLRRLKELGLSQKEIAAKIGASPAAVSMWCTGKHPFEDPYRTEAEMLLAVMTGQATESSGPFTFRPTVFMNPGGTTRTGDTPMSPDAIADLPKLRSSIQGLSPEHQLAAHHKFMARMIALMLPEYLDHDPLIWDPSAHQLDDIRRMVEALRLSIVGLLQLKARAAMPEEEPHVDEIP